MEASSLSLGAPQQVAAAQQGEHMFHLPPKTQEDMNKLTVVRLYSWSDQNEKCANR